MKTQGAARVMLPFSHDLYRSPEDRWSALRRPYLKELKLST